MWRRHDAAPCARRTIWSGSLLQSLQEQFGEDYVGEEDEDTAGHYAVGACFAHLKGAALHIVAVERRCRSDDEGEHKRLYQAIPHIPLLEECLEGRKRSATP